MNNLRSVIAPLLLLIAPGLFAQTDLSHRQSHVRVVVKNQSGTPLAESTSQALASVTVSVEMIEPAFRFGTAITANQIDPSHPDYDARLVKELQSNFNSVTFGNYMKWGPFESRSVTDTLTMVQRVFALRAFNSTQALRLRGHASVWGATYQVPVDFRAMTDRSQMRARLLGHIEDYHTAFRGSGVSVFDLYNEPFHETELIIDKLIDDPEDLAQHAAEAATWFNQAKAADPDAVLYINDYNIIDFWQEDDEDVAKYKALVDAIRDAGGQVDGIGLQAHIGRMLSKEQVTRRLDLLSAPMAATANHPAGLPGLEIEITELDINTEFWTSATPADQAEVTANILDAAFAHPAVVGITMWGMRDSTHWRDNAILFDDTDPENWEVKPSGQAWLDRVKGTWWTSEMGYTGADGTYTTAAYKGWHRITLTYGGKVKQFVRNLTAADELIELELNLTTPDTSKAFLSNLSVRTPLAEGQRLTLGFVVDGGEETVLTRVAGPALGNFGLPEFMADPELEVRKGGVLHAANEDWVANVVAPVARNLGAFPFATGSRDAGLVLNVTGPNTVEVSGAAPGIVLSEVYDGNLDTTGPRLLNVSALTTTQPGAGVLTAGFFVRGSGRIEVLIRGVGPELNSQYGVAGVVTDPVITLFRGQEMLESNNDWDVGLAPTMAQVGAFPLTPGSKDAAMIVSLEGNAGYTVQVVGADGQPGIAIIEVYALP